MTKKVIHHCPPYPVLHCDGGDACWDDCQRDGKYETIEVDRMAVYCHGCGHAWWDDGDCACACKPGDPNYEKWACPSAVGFEILNG